MDCLVWVLGSTLGPLQEEQVGFPSGSCVSLPSLVMVFVRFLSPVQTLHKGHYLDRFGQRTELSLQRSHFLAGTKKDLRLPVKGLCHEV